ERCGLPARTTAYWRLSSEKACGRFRRAPRRLARRTDVTAEGVSKPEEAVMRASRASVREAVKSSLIAIAWCVFLGAGRAEAGEKPIPLTVPKAVCGPNDHPETALQGQVPAAMRAAGFKGFNCNLELLGQSKGDGANWQT